MEEEIKKKRDIRERIQRVQRFLSVFLFLCVAYLIWYQWDSHQEEQKNRELELIAWQSAGEKAEPENEEEETLQSKTEPPVPEEKEEKKETPFAEGFRELSNINSDLRAWIFIPDTELSLPVVQGIDNSFYLRRDFYGNPDRHGTVFADCGADFYGEEKNMVLYGHNMKDGSMFGTLKEYQAESYYKEHPSFFITLPEEEREYRIIAVIRNDIFSRETEPFQYYDYKKIENWEMFDAYYQAVKERSLYDTGEEASYEDELITLCTCDYGGLDQRLLIIGKRVKA